MYSILSSPEKCFDAYNEMVTSEVYNPLNPRLPLMLIVDSGGFVATDDNGIETLENCVLSPSEIFDNNLLG